MKISYTNNDIRKITRKRNSTKLQPILDKFMERSETYMCITYDEKDGYKSAVSMYSLYKKAVQRSGYALNVWKDGDQVWFEKIVKPKSP